MKKLLTILAALILFGCQGLNEPDPSKPEPKPDPATAEITIEVTGTLSELLKRYDLPGITTLRLQGIMNYDDFEAVKLLPNLVTLDIASIKNVEIPENALSECILTNIMLPKNLKKICLWTFFNCPSLTSITIPASVETIEYSFDGCPKLASITFEAGSKLKTLYGFIGCTPLTSITIPASIEAIDAFDGCPKLASVTFEAGSKLNNLGGFRDCTSLTSITIPASVETIERYLFEGCEKLSSVTFEAGSKLKTIGGFQDCTSLTTVDASKCELVTKIGKYAFNGSTKLNLFKIGTVIPPTCDEMAFYSIGSSSVLKVPAGSVNAYKAASGWKDSFATITALD